MGDFAAGRDGRLHDAAHTRRRRLVIVVDSTVRIDFFRGSAIREIRRCAP